MEQYISRALSPSPSWQHQLQSNVNNKKKQNSHTFIDRKQAKIKKMVVKTGSLKMKLLKYFFPDY